MDLDEVPVPVREDTFVTVVAVVDEHTTAVVDLTRDAQTLLNSRYANYELVLVDNGLTSEQLIGLVDQLHVLPCIRIIRLSRRYSADTAIFAGLEAAIGDYVVVMTLGVDPVSAVPEVVTLNAAGHDIVQGLSTQRPVGGALTRFGRSMFYRYNRSRLGIDIPVDATNLVGLTRRAVNSLTNVSRNHRYLRHLIRHIGFRVVDYRYAPDTAMLQRSGLVREAVEMISSYSTHPLRMVTIAGVLAAGVNLLYAVYVVAVNIFSPSVERGWTTTSLQLSLMFIIISVILAVQSEYIGRILTESRREPSYFVTEELESDTLLSDLGRRNVSD
jgi:glycosyltransferase involved in cell wall biosynthesis